MGEITSNTTERELPAGWETLPEPARPAFLALLKQNQELSAEVARLRTEIDGLRACSHPSRWLSDPRMVLFASLGAMLAFAAFVVIDNGLGVNPERHGWFLYYMVPIAAPFIAFLLDRAARLRELRWFQWAIDLPVLVVALIRAVYPLPGISGDAVFLTYALLTTRSRVAQILSIIILAEVVYLKLFAWHDPTLFGGIVVAVIAAVLYNLPFKRKLSTA